MSCNIMNQFSFDFNRILIDEIALEGLQGVDIDLLWRRVEHRICNPITEKMKKRFWDFIISSPNITLYELPLPIPYLEIKDRFKCIEEDSGHLKDPEDYLDGPYEYKPVENDYGSCVGYKDRKIINNISSLTYEEVVMTYKHSLVMVASKEERFKALAPHLASLQLAKLSPVHYCILELIGRSRENGQMTMGKTNLLKIDKDAKMLFYHRNFLKRMGVVRATQVTQKIADRGVKSLLLRLRRFHKSMALSLPRVGPIHELIEVLKATPNYSDLVDNIFKRGILAQQRNKKLQKTYAMFDFVETEEEVETKKNVKQPIKRRYVSISVNSDESSSSEEETNEPELQCEYQVGVSLLRQAYMQVHKSGLKGLTQNELAQLLGIEFYTTRNICRTLRTNQLVKEVYEDKGRQRMARLVIAGTSVNAINVDYEDEWQKFLNYRVKITEDKDVKTEKLDTPATSSSLFYNQYIKDVEHWNEAATDIQKIEGLDGYDLDNVSLFSAKKSLTLRQLKYANGILKVLGDHLAVAGYQALNNLVATEVGESQMDTRALKVFLQKLLSDGLVKVFKLKWPEQGRHTNLICAAHITSDHTILKVKYGEILQRIHVTKQTMMTKQVAKGRGNRSLSRYTFPRYMKVRKFHEFVFKMAYFNDSPHSSNLPEGFCCLRDLIPMMTVEFALGNVNMLGKVNLTNAQVAENLNKLLKDVPLEVYKEIHYAGTFRNTIRENFRILAFFGLIQIINQPVTLNFDGIMFYVNRHAKIVNTVGVWPRAGADVRALECGYYLGSVEDVTDFWNTVFQISCNTSISVEKREISLIKPPIRTMDEVQTYDNGERLGDGNGPCGFDSSFFLEVPWLWRTMVKPFKGSKPFVLPLLIPKLKRKRKPIPKKIVKTKKVLAKEETRERIRELNELKIPVSRGKKQIFPSSGLWSKMEDLIIILCKVAHGIMGPIPQPGSCRLRNMVAKEILSMNDPNKTQNACHLRALFLDADTGWTSEKQRLQHEAKKRSVFKKYEGLLKKFRIRYVSKYMNEARVPMMELVWLLLQLTKSDSYKLRMPCIATNYENFNTNFTICLISDTKPHNIYNMPNATDSETILKQFIILAVAMSYNRELPVNMAKKIYALFKPYPEVTLRKAIEELRKCQAISARDKICNNKIYKMNLQDLVDSSYKLSAAYYRKWICKLNAEFMDSVADAMELELPSNDVKGGSGVNCFCCELYTSGAIDLASSCEPSLSGMSDSFIQEENLNVFDIQSKYTLNSGSIHVQSKTNSKKCTFNMPNLDEYVNAVQSNAIITQPNKEDIVAPDDIVTFLYEKQQKGSTFSELQEFTKSDSDILIQKLTQLESKQLIKRVGHYDNRIVHTEFLKTWTITIDGKTFLPAPWMTLYGTLRHEIFFSWTNVILSRIFEYPGCSIAYLSENLELITAKCVQDICLFLLQCECITIKVLRTPEVDLFSEDDGVEQLTQYNPYELPSNIVLLPTNNVLTRYATIRRKIMRMYEPKGLVSIKK